MPDNLPQNEIVLLGVGHTNAHVLKQWRMKPLADSRLTCVSNFGVATYSGMLPGTLAGQYQPKDMQIDLVRLCAAAGARLIQAEVTGLDVEDQRLIFANRPPLAFDALSIGVGSRPSAVPGEDIHVLRIKPMQTFLPRLHTRLTALARQVPERPWRIAVVGGGAGGFEIACCLTSHLQQHFPTATAELTLVDHNHDILNGMPPRAKALARQELARQRIELALDRTIETIDGDGRIQFDEGNELAADLILWATSASAPEVLDRLNLPQDERGFLLIKDTLQSTAADTVFAVGDTGTLEQQPLPKAGVYAVRQGPVLWESIQRLLSNQPLRRWRPQRSFLTLLNTGSGRAILTYKGVTAHAPWCWKLKDTIDRRFMAMYQDYSPTMAMPTMPVREESEMYCGGCGCKLPADVLTRVLSKLDNPQTEAVLVGLNQPDDVAVLNASQQPTAITTDFFTAFLDDPYLLGQVAAQNAMSDMYASLVSPQAALAMVCVPHGPVKRQEQFLLEVLDGALQVLRPAGVTIVGGHTIEGEQATVGFTIVGNSSEQQFATKTGLQPGDKLVLTKPIGSGILLAGHSQALCQANWYDQLIASMLESNREAGRAASELKIQALTDVTGFGLAGHLWEMVQASGVSAELSLDNLPILTGAEELAKQGVESSMTRGNRHFEKYLTTEAAVKNKSRYALLFDPQTSGGLLLGVSEADCEKLLSRLGGSASVVGQATKRTSNSSTIEIR